MRTLAWRSLLTRKLGILAALLSVVLGAALVTASLLVAGAQNQSGAASVTSWRFSAADAVVKPSASVTLNSGLALDLPSMPRLTEEQMAAIEGAPGVSRVSWESPFPAYAIGGDGAMIGDAYTRSWGHPWSTAVADGGMLTSGTEPTASDEVAIDASVADAAGIGVDDEIRVQLASGVEQFRVSGIVEREGEQFEHALFFTPDTAAEIGGAPVLGLVSTIDTAALQDAVPDLVVVTGEARAGSLQLDLRQAELAGGSGQFLLVIALLALTIAVFVISSTLTVSIGQRRRELAMLRVVGTKPKLIRRMIVWEAVLIGALGGVIGAGVGVAVAGLARGFFIAQGLMARDAQVSADPGALLTGFGAALVAAVLAAVLPAWRATRIAPLDALRESDLPARASSRRRTTAGIALLAAAVLCLAGVFALGGPVPTLRGSIALMLLVTAFPFLVGAAVLLGPVVLRVLLALAGDPLRRWFPGFLADRSIRSDLRRAAGVSVPLTLLVAVCSVLMFQDTANFQARSEVYADQVTADLVATGGVQLGLPLGTAEAIADVPGVSAASASVSSRLIIDAPSTARSNGTVTGVEPGSFHEVLNYPTTAGSWEDFEPGSIGISQMIADDKGWQIGDRIDFRYPNGVPGQATVSTIYHEPMGVSDMVLPVDALTPHLLEPFATAIYIAVDPGSDLGKVRAGVEDALTQTAPNATVVDRAGHLGQIADQASGDNWIILMVVVILGGYAGVSAINVLIGSTMSRRREFALLRLAGTPRKQVIGSLLIEGTMTAAAAVVTGGVIAAVTMAGYGFLLTGTLWLPFTWPVFASIIACTCLAALAGTLAPARTAMRADPLEAVRE